LGKKKKKTLLSWAKGGASFEKKSKGEEGTAIGGGVGGEVPSLRAQK